MRVLPLLMLQVLASKKTTSLQKHVKKETAQFGWGLLFDSGGPDENKVISPLSIMSAMLMVAAGAQGPTQTEIVNRMLNLDGKPVSRGLETFYDAANFLQKDGNEYTMSIANAVFHNDMTTAGYTEKLKDLIGKKVDYPVDFSDARAATDFVNKWVADNTNGKIAEMFSEPLDTDTVILLASSLYFKSTWAKNFDLITEKNGYDWNVACWKDNVTSTDCNRDVQFMQVRDHMRYKQVKSNKRRLTVIELPMKVSKSIETASGSFKNKMTFQIWLPREDIRDAATDKLYRDIIVDNIDIKDDTGFSMRKVKLTMPKFSIDFEQDIKELMRANGIETVFSEDKDLTPMVGDHNDEIEISKINHKVKFDVDENGMEGAAVSMVHIEMRTNSSPTPVVIGRPFYFAVLSECQNANSSNREKLGCPYSRIPVFVGKVVNPAK